MANIVDAIAPHEQGLRKHFLKYLKYLAVDFRDVVHTTYSKLCMTQVTFVVLL